MNMDLHEVTWLVPNKTWAPIHASMKQQKVMHLNEQLCSTNECHWAGTGEKRTCSRCRRGGDGTAGRWEGRVTCQGHARWGRESEETSLSAKRILMEWKKAHETALQTSVICSLVWLPSAHIRGCAFWFLSLQMNALSVEQVKYPPYNGGVTFPPISSKSRPFSPPQSRWLDTQYRV